MNEKLAIKKLFKIAQNQQKIIQKLAQQRAEVEAPAEYLKQAAQVAGLNSGFTITQVEVTATPRLTVTVSGVPSDAQARQKYTRTLQSQIAQQKPNDAALNSITIEFK